MKTIYGFVLVLVMCLSQGMKASHNMGGTISYSHISTSATTSTYQVNLKLLFDLGLGFPVTGSQMVFVVSDDGTFSDSLTMSETITTVVQPPCDGSVVNSYSGIINLPLGKDYRIYWSGCCRPGLTPSNLVLPSSQGFYIEAKLFLSNSAIRNFDNAPEPINVIQRGMNVGARNFIPVNWSELDGDSVYVELINARKLPASSVVTVPYAAGYSGQQPIMTSGGANSVVLYNEDSVFTAVPSLQSFNWIALRFNNYVYNSTTWAYELIGYSHAEYLIEVGALNPNGINIQLLGAVQSDSMFLETTPNYFTASHSYGEFELQEPSGVAIPWGITSVKPEQSTLGSKIRLNFSPSIPAGGYQVSIQNGSDQNTLIGTCGSNISPTIIPITIPFVPSSILSLTGGFGSGTYTLSSFDNLNSITWQAVGASLSQNGIQYGNQFTTTVKTPVNVFLSQPTGTLRAIRHGAGIFSDTLELTLASGIGTDELYKSLYIAPNPTEGIVKVNSHLNGSVALYSAFGILIEEQLITPEFDLQMMPAGVYFLRFSFENGTTQVVRVVRR